LERKLANQVVDLNPNMPESEITEEVELGETIKTQDALKCCRPNSAYSTASKPAFEGGDSAMELLEDGGAM